MWGEAIERMPADGRKHPECAECEKTKEMEITTRDETIEFYKSEIDKISDEKVSLERGIIKIIKLLGD
jgi:transcription elongation factor Elf1